MSIQFNAGEQHVNEDDAKAWRVRSATRKKIVEQAIKLHPDIEEQILARLDCAGRSNYCADRGTPRKETTP
jgi:hypothetical protein